MRFKVTEPVPGGYAYFDVIAVSGFEYPNFAVATFFKDIPHARDEAYALRDRLNAGGKTDGAV
jgi:hypothetical protein